MKKAVAWLAGILVLIVILMAALVALSPAFLNKYKDQIVAKVGEAVDREIRLGDIRLTLFTGMGLRLKDVSVSNAKGFRDEPMLVVSDLDVKVKAMPLLRKQLEVVRVILRKPQVLIEKNAEGVFNFSDLTGPSEPAADATPGKAKPAASSSLAGLLVSKLELSDGTLAYFDAGSGALREGLRIQQLGLSLEEVSLDKPIPFSLSFGINREAEDIRASGTLGPVGEKMDYETIPVSIQLAVPDFALKRAMDLLGGTPPVLIESGTLKGETSVNGDLASGMKVAGSLNVASLTLKDPEKKETQIRGLNLGLQKELLVRMGEQKIVVEKASLSADRARLDLSGEVLNFQKDPSLSLKLSSNDIPLSGWDKIFPALAGVILDGTVKANGSLSGKPAKKIQAVVNLTSPRLDVKLPKKAASVGVAEERVAWQWVAAAEAASKGAAKGKGGSAGLPQNLDIKGRIDIAQGSFDNIPFSQFQANYAKTGNRIDVTDLSMRGFGAQGAATGRATVNFGTAKPSYSVDLKFSQVDLAAVQQTFAARTEKIVGGLSGQLALSGSGFALKDMEQSLTGSGDLKVEQGALPNVNLEERILSAVAQKFGLPVATLAQMVGVEISQGNQTPFEEFHGIFRIAGGKIDVRDAAITSGNHGFSSMGDIGLNQTLNLKSRLILRKVGDPGSKKLTYYLIDEKSRKYIPFKVTGKTAKPVVTVDIEALVRGQAQRAIDEKKEELKDKLKEKLGPEGEEILKPLEKLFRF
jgi:AsmA protein